MPGIYNLNFLHCFFNFFRRFTPTLPFLLMSSMEKKGKSVIGTERRILKYQKGLVSCGWREDLKIDDPFLQRELVKMQIL